MRKIILHILLAVMFIATPAAAAPLDILSVPAFGPASTGSSVESSIILDSGAEYSIVVTGTFQFKTGVDWGYADAQYRMGAGKVYSDPFKSIEFNGERVSADISDVATHTYTFNRKGSGTKIKFSIYDATTMDERGDYDNNAGNLKVEIFRLDTISLTRSASPETTELGNATTITLTLTNTGTADLKNITVSDTVPVGFTLATGSQEKNYDILKTKESRSFQYSIKPSETGTFSLPPASVSYYDKDGSPYTGKSGATKVIVVPSTRPVDKPASNASVQLHGEKTDVQVGEEILLKLSAVNLISKPVMHVQVIILPPSGMSVTSSEFAQSGAGQFTTTYEIPPGKGRDIEVKMRSNQAGEFKAIGRIVYYFGDDSSHYEEYEETLTITVRDGQQPTTSTPTQENGNWLPGFGALIAVIGILALYIIKKNRTK
ncbi:MAG: BatD family protein [Candidatus Methanoperedenaceae archaeon]|nr:BatD family protein [Candidatus Methanoperedenaceae archaeon]